MTGIVLFWVAVAFVLYLFIIGGACQIAIRKGRSVNTWGIFVAFFPVAFLILAILPRSRSTYVGDEDSPHLTSCPACMKQISSQARSCPFCGNPRPKKKKGPYIWEGMGWASFLILGSVLIIARTQYIPGSPDVAFPRCDSFVAKRSAVAALADSPMGRLGGIKIIDWDDIVTLSLDDRGETCHAQVLLNSNAKVGSTYRFRNNNGTMLVEFKFDEGDMNTDN